MRLKSNTGFVDWVLCEGCAYSDFSYIFRPLMCSFAPLVNLWQKGGEKDTILIGLSYFVKGEIYRYFEERYFVEIFCVKVILLFYIIHAFTWYLFSVILQIAGLQLHWSWGSLCSFFGCWEIGLGQNCIDWFCHGIAKGGDCKRIFFNFNIGNSMDKIFLCVAYLSCNLV